MKKHKNKIITGVVVLIVLFFAFWYGGDAPGLRGWKPEIEEKATVIQNDEPTKEEFAKAENTTGDIPVKKENAPATEENKPQKKDETPMTLAEKLAENQVDSDIAPTSEETVPVQSAEIVKSNEEHPEEQAMIINEDTGKDKYLTDPIPEGKPVPVEPENSVITDKELNCTLSVRCDTVFENIGWLDSEKVEIIPKDGVIFEKKTVTFYEGESVFNLLLREMKKNKIHMEFENIPIYNSAYIEGIANLYEFDCGELSGWMYKVNDWFPNYGCSRYQLKPGDRVEWVYTCNLGIDVGGYYSAKSNR